MTGEPLPAGIDTPKPGNVWCLDRENRPPSVRNKPETAQCILNALGNTMNQKIAKPNMQRAVQPYPIIAPARAGRLYFPAVSGLAFIFFRATCPQIAPTVGSGIPTNINVS